MVRRGDFGIMKSLGKLEVWASLVGQCYSSRCISRTKKCALRVKVGSREKRSDFHF